MKLLLVDLDDTLINTEEFKTNVFQEIAATMKSPVADVKHIYEEIKLAEAWYFVFIQKVIASKKITAHQIDAIFEKHLAQISIYNKVVDYVKAFEGYKVLFTYGDTSFQRKKIELTKVHFHVDEVLITNTEKFTYFRNLIKEKELIIHTKRFTDVTVLDNNEPLLHSISTHFPWVKTVSVSHII